MAAQHHSLDLATLSLSSGQATTLELPIDPGGLDLGGARYTLDGGPTPARLDVSRTATGHALRLRFDGRLAGPCVRCLEPADVAVDVDAREVDQPASGDEELRSPYVDEDVVDLTSWAHDALALALPQQLLCRPECAGLCTVCGESLNGADPADHEHESAPDPRLAKLRELLD